MVNMDSLIAQVRNLNADGLNVVAIRLCVGNTEPTVSEYDFFLAYKAAELLPGWVTAEAKADAQSMYEDLFG